ncbi:MAG TPA: hypothetical protein VIH50_07615 [Steroidobacteraceae bacterium]|jgi:hypothetical protein
MRLIIHFRRHSCSMESRNSLASRNFCCSIAATLRAMRDRARALLPSILMCAAGGLGQAAESPLPAPQPAASAGCLASGDGFLRARIRGALNLDIDWKNAQLECDGSPRPDGRGIRVSFAGPQQPNGRRIRVVFGVATSAEGASGRALPTNVTLIVEGEKRLFTTRGDDRCTIDQLRQERLAGAAGAHAYRVVARGFCTLPAMALDQVERVVITRFDFAGRVSFDLSSPTALPEAPR